MDKDESNIHVYDNNEVSKRNLKEQFKEKNYKIKLKSTIKLRY